MSRDGCVALPCGAMVCLRFVIVVFPDHTHYFCPRKGHYGCNLCDSATAGEMPSSEQTYLYGLPGLPVPGEGI